MRGEGFTRQTQDAHLWERTECGEGEEGAVLASGWSKVTEAIVDLVGFRSDQFRQVIMLPQGKFRDLLDAGSRDREEILEDEALVSLRGDPVFEEIVAEVQQRLAEARAD